MDEVIKIATERMQYNLNSGDRIDLGLLHWKFWGNEVIVFHLFQLHSLLIECHALNLWLWLRDNGVQLKQTTGTPFVFLLWTFVWKSAWKYSRDTLKIYRNGENASIGNSQNSLRKLSSYMEEQWENKI